MKKCPKCEEIYSDNNLNFCLSDGTSLITASDSSFEETIIRPPHLVQPAGQTGKQNINPSFVYLLIGLLVLFIGIGFFFWLWSGNEVLTASNTKVENSTPFPDSNQTPANETIKTPKINNNTLATEESLDIEGIWKGRFNDLSATLILKHIDKNNYTGTITKGAFVIAVDVNIKDETKQVFFKETGVIKGKGWGELGQSSGFISENSKNIKGGGIDENGTSYSWSFRKQ